MRKKQNAGVDPLAQDAGYAEVMAALENTLRAGESVVHNYETSSESLAEEGTKDGLKGNPAADSTSSFAEDKIMADGREAASRITNINDAMRLTINDKIAAEESSISTNKTKDDYLKELEMEKEELKTQADRQVTPPTRSFKLRMTIWGNRTVAGVLVALEEQLRQLKEQKIHIDTLYDKILRTQYNNTLPLKRFFLDRLIPFWGVIFLFTVFEIGVNFDAFQNLGIGESNTITLGLGFFFTIVQSIGATLLGAAWYQRHLPYIYRYGALTLVACTLITWSRMTQFGGSDGIQAEPLVTIVVYCSINFIFAAVTIFLSYKRAIHAVFFDVARKRENIDNQIVQVDSQKKEIEKSHGKSYQTIETKIAKKSEDLANADRKQGQNRIERYRSALKQLNASQKDFLLRLEKAREIALMRYRHLSQEARRLSNHPPVLRWQNTPPHSSNGKAHSPQTVLSAAALVVISGLGLTGCSNPPVEEEIHIEAMIDKTEGNRALEVEPMLDFIQSFVFTDNHKEKWGNTTVTLSPIGQTSNQSIQVVRLPASKPYWIRKEKEHRKLPLRFRADLQYALEVLTKPDTALPQSYIPRNLYYRIKALSQEQGKKIVFCCSDLIVNDHNVNFYLFKEHPELIWEQKDSLIAQMTKDYSLQGMNLKGIKIINIHQPTKEFDELHEACKRFFQYYWTSLGMEVEFKTNIPLAHEFAVER